ncbi:Dehydrodolichyl diphosphate synthase 6 [Morus notabilis]|uniref:Alkyl transferase n=1 Tax=Morus notabilis TaxID=981085 RepID=W9RKB2_9ROSA|nr:dehydrodolichyl diphosphate synthase 6 [Morus notabilis]EXB95131.1 Dehydrodolichyl diphosphate synthase 6 [Morus notabilis]
MEKMSGRTSQLFRGSVTFLRKCLFNVISIGPIPDHIAFIMDGNRRYAKKQNSAEGAGHKAGYSSLMSMLGYCYELGVKYVTVYAFSIDNFKRRPEEVQYLMDLMLEKIDELLEHEGIINQYGIRVYFIGNLKLLNEPVRVAAEKAMKATAKNNKAVLLVCVAYTSRDEIVHAVKESCKNKRRELQTHLGSKVANGASEGVEEDKKMGLNKGLVIHDAQDDGLEGSEAVEKTDRMLYKGEGNSDDIATRTCKGLLEDAEVREKQRKLPSIKLVDVEKHMYMGVAPNPDILIRSSGETRLSNFLLWQTANCSLSSPAVLWPELGLRHLVWAVLNFQRSYQYFEKKRKKI